MAHLLALVGSVCLFLALASGLDASPSPKSTSRILDNDYWLRRRQEFFKNTTWPLTEANLELFGGKYAQVREGHLPFWFDFELYKAAFEKKYTSNSEELDRHHAYIRTCVKTLRARTLFRILAGTKDTLIDATADRLATDPRGGYFTAEEEQAAQQVVQSNEIAYKVQFEIDRDTSESPVAKAIRLVRHELDLVESRNQLNHYLMAFEDAEGSAIPKDKLPYDLNTTTA